MTTKNDDNSTQPDLDNSSDLIGNPEVGDRPPPDVQLVLNPESTSRDSLDLLRTELWNHRAPLTHRGRADLQRPRDIRGRLKVIEGGLLEHARHLTTVHSWTQPQSKTGLLTLVDMESSTTLADRLKSAMDVAGLSASDLARKCKVSPAAVHKWLQGGTKKLSAESLAAAARALGVYELWLRTGKGPRQGEHADEERTFERVIELLDEIRPPLAALLSAIDRLAGLQSAGRKRTG